MGRMSDIDGAYQGVWRDTMCCRRAVEDYQRRLLRQMKEELGVPDDRRCVGDAIQWLRGQRVTTASDPGECPHCSGLRGEHEDTCPTVMGSEFSRPCRVCHLPFEPEDDNDHVCESCCDDGLAADLDLNGMDDAEN